MAVKQWERIARETCEASPRITLTYGCECCEEFTNVANEIARRAWEAGHREGRIAEAREWMSWALDRYIPIRPFRARIRELEAQREGSE